MESEHQPGSDGKAASARRGMAEQKQSTRPPVIKKVEEVRGRKRAGQTTSRQAEGQTRGRKPRNTTDGGKPGPPTISAVERGKSRKKAAAPAPVPQAPAAQPPIPAPVPQAPAAQSPIPAPVPQAPAAPVFDPGPVEAFDPSKPPSFAPVLMPYIGPQTPPPRHRLTDLEPKPEPAPTALVAPPVQSPPRSAIPGLQAPSASDTAMHETLELPPSIADAARSAAQAPTNTVATAQPADVPSPSAPLLPASPGVTSSKLPAIKKPSPTPASSPTGRSPRASQKMNKVSSAQSTSFYNEADAAVHSLGSVIHEASINRIETLFSPEREQSPRDTQGRIIQPPTRANRTPNSLFEPFTEQPIQRNYNSVADENYLIDWEFTTGGHNVQGLQAAAAGGGALEPSGAPAPQPRLTLQNLIKQSNTQGQSAGTQVPPPAMPAAPQPDMQQVIEAQQMLQKAIESQQAVAAQKILEAQQLMLERQAWAALDAQQALAKQQQAQPAMELPMEQPPVMPPTMAQVGPPHTPPNALPPTATHQNLLPFHSQEQQTTYKPAKALSYLDWDDSPDTQTSTSLTKFDGSMPGFANHSFPEPPSAYEQAQQLPAHKAHFAQLQEEAEAAARVQAEAEAMAAARAQAEAEAMAAARAQAEAEAMAAARAQAEAEAMAAARAQAEAEAMAVSRAQEEADARGAAARAQADAESRALGEARNQSQGVPPDQLAWKPVIPLAQTPVQPDSAAADVPFSKPAQPFQIQPNQDPPSPRMSQWDRPAVSSQNSAEWSETPVQPQSPWGFGGGKPDWMPPSPPADYGKTQNPSNSLTGVPPTPQPSSAPRAPGQWPIPLPTGSSPPQLTQPKPSTEWAPEPPSESQVQNFASPTGFPPAPSVNFTLPNQAGDIKLSSTSGGGQIVLNLLRARSISNSQMMQQTTQRTAVTQVTEDDDAKRKKEEWIKEMQIRDQRERERRRKDEQERERKKEQERREQIAREEQRKEAKKDSRLRQRRSQEGWY